MRFARSIGELSLPGAAAAALAVPVYCEPEKPYAKEIKLVDSLHAGDVAVMTQSGTFGAGLWGRLLSTEAKRRGARGAVVDGLPGIPGRSSG